MGKRHEFIVLVYFCIGLFFYCFWFSRGYLLTNMWHRIFCGNVKSGSGVTTENILNAITVNLKGKCMHAWVLSMQEFLANFSHIIIFCKSELSMRCDSIRLLCLRKQFPIDLFKSHHGQNNQSKIQESLRVLSNIFGTKLHIKIDASMKVIWE